MYTREQIEYSDFILKTMKDYGGRMEKSHLAGILHDKYDYAIEPELQLLHLINEEQLLRLEGAWLFLTKKGQKVDDSSMSRYLSGIETQEKTKLLSDRLTVVKLIVEIICIIISFFLGRLSVSLF